MLFGSCRLGFVFLGNFLVGGFVVVALFSFVCFFEAMCLCWPLGSVQNHFLSDVGLAMNC